jgi:CubicO group peptidase (beta-lactamase class C family)
MNLRRLALASVAFLALPGCFFAARHAVQLTKQHNSSRNASTQAAQAPPGTRAELEAVLRLGVPGVTAIAMKDGRQLFRLDLGNIASQTEYPVASASKWLAAALVMSVVDQGLLSLDEPVSTHLPVFKGRAGEVTLRELLAQTSGEGGLSGLVDVKQSPRMTLAESAAEVANRPLQDPPGKVFRYGGPGFQVAGALVEAVTGKKWAQLFDERIARPLGMTHTRWIHLPDWNVPAAETSNPLLQGGLVTTAEDYMRFLTLLAGHGQIGKTRVLSRESVDTLETVQTLGKEMAYVPAGVNVPLQYALGNWCAKWKDDGRCELALSPGAFGTWPWLDRRTGIYGIFFLRGHLPRVTDNLRRAMSAIITAY